MRPAHGVIHELSEVMAGCSRDERDLAWRVKWIQTRDHLAGDGAKKSLSDDGLLDKLSGLWREVPAKDLVLAAAALVIIATSKSDEEATNETERGFFGDFRHNILEGNSVIGGLVTGRPSPEVVRSVIDNAPDVARTLEHAATEIRSLNPSSIEGAQLLATDPGQFVDNYVNFFGGAKDWTVDTAKLVGALSIASSPIANSLYEDHTGTNVREEVALALRGAASLAAEDPDAFAAMAIDWEGLEQDPIRWAGNQAPEVVIEVLTAGGASSAAAGRRAANAIGEAADAASSVPATRLPTATAPSRIAVPNLIGSIAEDTSRWAGNFLDELALTLFPQPSAASSPGIVSHVHQASRIDNLPVDTRWPLGGPMPKPLPAGVSEQAIQNALKGWRTANIQVGNRTIRLSRDRMGHFLQRHHPEFWDGSTATNQSFLPETWTIQDVEDSVRHLVAESRASILEHADSSRMQFEGSMNGRPYVLTIEDGQVVQFFLR